MALRSFVINGAYGRLGFTHSFDFIDVSGSQAFISLRVFRHAPGFPEVRAFPAIPLLPNHKAS
jgi:hypothetical protein